MTDLRIQATVSADGKQASAELKRLAGDIGRTKQEMVEAAAASKAAAAALKTHAQSAGADAAETLRLRDALIAARAAEAEAARSHAISTSAMNAQGRAAQNLAGSNNQARASLTNLGQQVNDVAVGFAAGVAPATIFAQQAGQIAFALQGTGGALKGVGAFLGGPWGIALTTAAVVISPFIGKLFESGEASKAARREQEQLAQALEGVQRSARGAGESVADGIRAMTADMSARLDPLRDKLAAVRAEFAAAKAEAAGAAGRVGLQRFGLTDFLFRGADERAATAAAAARQTAGQLAAGEAAIAERARRDRLKNDARLATDPQFAVRERASQARSEVLASVKDEAEARRRLIAINREEEASLERLSALKSSASRAGREAAKSAKELTDENQKLAEAYNPLLAAQQDYKKALDDIAKAEARGIVGAGLAADARLSAAETLRQARLKALGAAPAGPIQLAGAGALGEGLSAQVFAGDLARELDATVAQIGKDLGLTTGKDFGKSALEFSQVIGNGIAGGFGRALQRSTAFAALFDRLSPGQGGVFQVEFDNTLRSTFKPLTDGLAKLVGSDGALAKLAGRAAGGAAVGGLVANVFGLGSTGAQLGGAIGASLEKPLGKALGSIAKGLGDFAGPIGSIVGSLVGGLFKGKNPFADASLTTTAAGVSSTIFNQRGSGSSAQGQQIGGAVGSQLSQIASALGAEIKAGLNLGAIGFSGDQFYFNPSGGDFKGAGAQRFASGEEAVAAAVANALSTGAIATSPKVQAALQRYAGNVNQAVAEALKVRDLESQLEAQGNPFAAAFRDFERQARQRVDIARQYGFDVIEIEKLNADQRAALVRDTLDRATGSARALLDEFRFGDRAGGSVRDRLTTLGGERERLAGLVRGGDGGQLDALADVIRQIDDLQREAFGATGEAANGRAASAALLQELIDATEARVRTAAEAAQRAAAEQLNTLQSMDGTLEDIFQNGRQQLAALQAIQARMGGGGGGVFDFDLANSVARD